MTWFIDRIYIKRFERGLLFRRGDFVRLLQPGFHTLVGWPVRRHDRVETQDTLAVRFEHAQIDVLVEAPAVKTAVHVVDLADDERALVWQDGRLALILGPGRHALWRDPFELEIETFSRDAFVFEHDRIDAVLEHPHARHWFGVVLPEPNTECLVYRDGTLVARVKGKRLAYWSGPWRVDLTRVGLREDTLDVSGQEIMTNDKVTLRVNLVVTFQVEDPVKATEASDDFRQALYREAQLALRAAVGTRTLDALLTDKQSVGPEVLEAVRDRAAALGAGVRSVGLRDIVLPGDMKTILNQVIEAEKKAEANLIRRREETAAARSQANTARLLEANPTLARMKELELLKDVLEGTKATFVFGSGELRSQLRSLVDPDEAS